jgi:hypothetical protein
MWTKIGRLGSILPRAGNSLCWAGMPPGCQPVCIRILFEHMTLNLPAKGVFKLF